MNHQTLYKLKSNRENKSRLKTFQSSCQQKRNDIFQASRIIEISPATIKCEKENVGNIKSVRKTNKILSKVEKQEAFYANYLAWKKEKDKKRMEEKMKQKKPFYTACSKLNNCNQKLNIFPIENKKCNEIVVPKKNEKRITLKETINNINNVVPINQQINTNNMRAPQKIPPVALKRQTTMTKIPFKSKEQIIPTKTTILSDKEPTTSKNLRIIKSVKRKVIQPIKKSTKQPSNPVKSKKEFKFTFLNEKKSNSIIEQTPIENPEHPFKSVFTSTQRKETSDNNLINSDELMESTISPIDFKNDDILINLNKSQDQNYWPSPMQQRKSLLSSTLKLNYLSPYVSTSRGKVNAKKEKEKRDSVYLLENTSPEEISITKRRMKEAVRRFYKLLNDETERLEELCNNWKQYMNENINLLNDNGGIDMINATLGQTKLLLTKKFKQFQELIDKCENYTVKNIDGKLNEEKPIYPEDLEGFWGMVNIQIEDIDKRFHNIKRWRENNWIDPDDIKPKVKKIRPMSMVHKKPKKNTIKPSNEFEGLLKKIISDGKRNKLIKQQENNKDILIVSKNTRRQSSTKVSSKENTPLRRSSMRNSKPIATPYNKQIENQDASVIKRRRKSKSLTPGCKKYYNENITPQKSNTPKPKKSNHENVMTPCKSNIRSEWKCVNLLKSSKEMITGKITPVQTPRKSILKTPGTSRKNFNVIFNEELDFRSPDVITESKLNSAIEPKERKRSLRLRTRILMIDPEANIELPK